MGPFSDPPKRRPRDDRSGGPGSESREDTTRIRKSTTRRTTASTTRGRPRQRRRQQLFKLSSKKMRGVERSVREVLSRLLDTKNFHTRRPRKTSRHQRSQRSELEKREILNRLLDTEISSATLEHQEKEESRDRRRHATTQARSALRTKTMQNQWFLKGPIHISSSKVPSKDQRCPEVKLEIPKPTSGHQEVPGLTTRSEVSRG